MSPTQLQSLPFFFSALLAAGVVLWVRKFRGHPGGRTFIFMMLAVAVWASMAGLEVIVTSLTANLMTAVLAYPGVLGAPVFFFLFVVQFTGHDSWLSRRNLVLFWIIPTVTMLLVLTNPWHHLHWSFLTPDPVLGESLIYYGHGPWFYVMIVYLYTLMLTATVLLFQAVFSFQKAFRLQTLAILISAPLPWLGNILYVLGVSPMPGLDMAPIFFAITGLILSVAIFRFQLLDLVPVARETVIEGLLDGILVIDTQNRIIDLNPAAKTLLNLPDQVWVGQSGIGAVPQIQTILDNPTLKIELQTETRPNRWLELHMDLLHSHDGRMLGHLLTIRNITERKQMELALQEKTRQLEHLAISDSLTELFNRRYIEAALQLEFGRCERYLLSLSIAMFDIDLFKLINDRFGHPCGDEVIRWVAQKLGTCMRACDIAARVGGDEFLILFPQSSPQDAWQAMERLRSVLAEKAPGTGEPISISGGVTAWYPGDSPNAALQRVDRLLYRAKERGRNLILSDAPETGE